MPTLGDIVQQFKNLNYLLNQVLVLNKDSSDAFQKVTTELAQISNSLEKLNLQITDYQSAITNQSWFSFVIGTFATIAATWLYEKLKERKSRRDYVFKLHREIVDQINMVIEIEETIKKFIGKIDTLLRNIDATPPEAYAVNSAFFPLFSARSLPESVNEMSSGSGYVDNKVGKIYSLSKDIPFIVDDLRLQFNYTLESNEKISFAKLNAPLPQRAQFKDNILTYKKALQEDMLEKNIPTYLRKLAEANAAVREKLSIYPITWKIRHDPRWRFYLSKKDYLTAREKIMDSMDKYFEDKVKKELDTINIARNSG